MHLSYLLGRKVRERQAALLTPLAHLGFGHFGSLGVQSAAGLTRRVERRTENEHAGRLKSEPGRHVAGEQLEVTCRKETI